MRQRMTRFLSGLREQLLLLRLCFVKVEKPGDARTPEQMLGEVKKKSKFT